MQEGITVTEAARRLGVSRSKIWRMLSDGDLVAHPNPLDKRQRLIPESAIRALAGRRTRPRPRTAGALSDPDLRSDQLEEYLEAHWRPE